MAKTSTAVEVGQEGSLREGLEAAIRERVREIIEMVLQEKVETALGARRRESGFATGAGGAGGSGERRESAAEPDDHGSGIRRRLAVVARRSGHAEDGPS